VSTPATAPTPAEPAARPAPAAGSAAASAHQIALSLAAATRPSGSVSGIELLPLAAHAGVVEVTEGYKHPRQVDYRMEADEDGQWRLSTDGTGVVYFRKGNDGAVEITREDDMGENVAVSYEPPIVGVPTALVPGKMVRGSVNMTVRNLKNGHVRDAGRCDYTVELLGRQEVTTPAGRFDAYVIRSTRTIELKHARSQVTIQGWYVPAKGEVLEHVKELTTALGVLEFQSEQVTRLVK
jgi:hypothetical protein